jgi:methyltransferase (TIGR00027 family)
MNSQPLANSRRCISRVQNEQPSGTALLISASLVLLHRDPKFSSLVSKRAADLYEQVLENCSGRTRLSLALLRQRWVRSIATIIERITIPGILLHYALRKVCIKTLARFALVDGVTQVVVIGAGFDSLNLELEPDFPTIDFWEIDHPATQRFKLHALSELGPNRVHFVPADLNADGLDKEALIKSHFDPARRTFWIAEGLLMYLREERVSSLMKAAASLSAPASRFAFTFMEKLSDGRIRFHSQTKSVDWWLRRRGEPFLWGTTRGELESFIRPWRVIRFFDRGDLRGLEPRLADEPLAKGEMICLAEL